MRLSLELAPTKPLLRLRDLAVAAERYGYCAIWVSDHYFNRNSIVLLTLIASSTARIEFGPGVLNPYVTHPAVMAQLAATLGELYGERVLLGIGAGDAITLESLGIIRTEPLRRVRDAVTMVRRLLNGERLSDNVRLDFKCESRVRIYVGAQSPMMLKLAGSIADGVLINTTMIDHLRENVKHVLSGIESSGRERNSVSIEATLTVAIGDEGARRMVAPYAATIAASAGDALLEELGIGEEERRRLKTLVRSGAWLKLFEEKYVEKIVDNFAIVGKKEEVFEQIDDILSLGVDGIVIGGPLGSDPMNSIRVIAERYLMDEHTSISGRDL